jgi:putative SOS response-associated peptidase YedK
MKDGSPFALAGIWENWQDPASQSWIRTFAVITVPANEAVGRIHNRMPAILAPAAYDRWLGTDPDPRDLLVPYPPEPMRLWPISTRVNSPRNDDPAVLEPIDVRAAI